MSCIRRRCLTVLLVGVLLGAISLPLEAGDIGVMLDGEPLNLPEAPFIQQGRTLVPLRAFWEALGARVSWDPETRTARGQLGRKVVEVIIDAPEARVDGREVPLEVPAQIVAGRTYIPLRFAGEALNSAVSWDAGTRTVYVESGSPLRTIKGTVYDRDRGVPLPGVNVLAYWRDRDGTWHFARTGHTDVRGGYRLEVYGPGALGLVFQRDGYWREVTGMMLERPGAAEEDVFLAEVRDSATLTGRIHYMQGALPKEDREVVLVVGRMPVAPGHPLHEVGVRAYGCFPDLIPVGEDYLFRARIPAGSWDIIEFYSPNVPHIRDYVERYSIYNMALDPYIYDHVFPVSPRGEIIVEKDAVYDLGQVHLEYYEDSAIIP